MDDFKYKNGELYCENVPAAKIAEEAGTPVYVYSRNTILDHYRKLRDAFSPVETLICYSVKANSNLAILKLMAGEGSGFDIVSGGELYRVLQAGADPKKVVFSGVAKSDGEIRAGLEAGIRMFNVESLAELENIDRIGRSMDVRAPVALRLNPDVDPKTHRYITTGKKENKFGIDLASAREALKKAAGMTGIEVIGLDAHIGSQITRTSPYGESLSKVVSFLKNDIPDGIKIRHLDCGGGFGIHYRAEEAKPASEFAETILPLVKETDCTLILEPGRFIVGNAGILLTTVEYVKQAGEKRFVICDAGMHTLIRPALYGGFHKIWPVKTEIDRESVDWTADLPKAAQGTVPTDIVGPICETGDFFAQDRPLPPVERRDRLAIFSAGAYGFVMASQYNSHPLPTEVLVEGDAYRVVRRRQTYEELIQGETV